MQRFYKMVEASNNRFPEGVEPYQMATRLLEECGEIAAEINLWENSGVKRQKHGDPKKEDIANEIRQAIPQKQAYRHRKQCNQSGDQNLFFISFQHDPCLLSAPRARA